MIFCEGFLKSKGKTWNDFNNLLLEKDKEIPSDSCDRSKLKVMMALNNVEMFLKIVELHQQS